MLHSADVKTDAGYFFLGPPVLKRTKRLANGMALGAYHQNGVIVSETPGSPWHQATLFVQGTLVMDGEGKVIRDVGLCESTDADGDLTWGVRYRAAGTSGTLQLIVGTGKWEGISGHGQVAEALPKRADGYVMPRWEIGWQVAPQAGQHPGDTIEAGKYTDHDRGLSFHGPHITEFARELTNGITLVVSNQSGVLTSENPAAKSPRNYATNFDRGTTIKRGDKTLGDVMLLEDTDPDGDIVWLYHIWWYGKGPGTYRFIGGTGKWEGITGEGRTLGMLRQRADDHYMLKSEMHWKIERGE